MLTDFSIRTRSPWVSPPTMPPSLLTPLPPGVPGTPTVLFRLYLFLSLSRTLHLIVSVRLSLSFLCVLHRLSSSLRRSLSPSTFLCV